jgi:hypothetical protein
MNWVAILAMCESEGWKALMLDLQNQAQEWEVYQRTATLSESERLKWQGRREHLQTIMETEARARAAIAQEE